MSKLYQPLTPLGKSLLHSIPRKVYLWLQSLGVDLSVAGDHSTDTARVTWDFTNDQALVTLSYAGWPVLSVYWDYDMVSSSGTKSGTPLAEPIEDNLSWFTELEQDIYSVLQDLDDKLREERNKPK